MTINIFFRFLNKFGQSYKLRLLLLFFAAILAGLIEVAGMVLIFPLLAIVNDETIIETNYYLSLVYNTIGFTSPKHMIFLIAGSIGLIFIMKNLYMLLFHYAQLHLLKKWRDELCDKVMTKYLMCPYHLHLKYASRDLINTLNYTVYYVLNVFILPAITFISCIIVSLILLIFIMVQFFWASLISGIFLFIIAYIQSQFIKKATTKMNNQVNKTRAVNLSVLTQSIGAIKETKSFNKEKYFKDMFTHSNGRVSEFDRRAVFLQFIPMYITEVALVITVITMSILVLSQTYSPLDGITSLAILAAVAFRMAPMISRALAAYGHMRISVGSTKELLDQVEDLEKWNTENFETEHTNQLQFKTQLALKKVSFEYTSGTNVLHNISLDIKKGEFIGIVGASGSGKTTLADILLGLLNPTHGNYSIDGIRIENNNLISLRQLMGYVSQNPYIFDASIRENVAYGVPANKINDEKVIEVLRMAQLDNFLQEKDGYIHANIGDNGKGLSGGQRQRLAIARALYHNPQIIILDEATSSLDVETEHQITQVINQLKGEKTIIAIAHRLSTLKECDRIVYMAHGKILDIGSFKELSDNHTDFARILELSSPRAH